MTTRFFLFGTPGGYSLWESVAGAAMPAKVSRKVVSQAKEIPTLLQSVFKILQKIDDPILIYYAPPERVKREGCRPLNPDEIQKAKQSFFNFCVN
jgi:hypothetical protein